MSVDFSKYVVSTSVSGGKYWEVEVEGCEMRVRYGALGKDAKWSSKTFASPEKALKEAESKLKSKLNKGYGEAPRPSDVQAVTGNLSEVPLLGVFYFRSYDRFPGGNRDMATVKVTLDIEPGTKANLRGKVYRDWDGEHWVYPETVIAIPAIEENIATLIGTAQNLVNQGLNQTEFWILDPRVDSDEYDTEWSSLEFSLYVKDGGDPGQLVAHVQQKALAAMHSRQKLELSKLSEPDAASAQFIEAVFKTAGIGRVETFSDNECAFCLSYNPSVEGESHGYKDSPVPLYL